MARVVPYSGQFILTAENLGTYFVGEYCLTVLFIKILSIRSREIVIFKIWPYFLIEIRQ